jgi:hypothetical protein
MVQPRFFAPQVDGGPGPFWAVDDPWLSAMLALGGTKIWAEASILPPRRSSVGRLDALFFSQIEGHTRDTQDAQCVAHFRADKGIWSDAVLRPIFPSALHQAARQFLPHRLRAFLTGRRA